MIDIRLPRYRTTLTEALLLWADAVEANTGRRPREMFVDMATRNRLVCEGPDYGNVFESAPGVFKIAGVRVRVIE